MPHVSSSMLGTLAWPSACKTSASAKCKPSMDGAAVWLLLSTAATAEGECHADDDVRGDCDAHERTEGTTSTVEILREASFVEEGGRGIHVLAYI